VLTISDRGLGISEARRAELNRLLEKPPVLGLALDPTLGMYVVARLAARHGINVRLVPGVPGTTARIVIPRNQLEIPKPGSVVPEDDLPSDEELAEAVAPWFDEHRPAMVTNGSHAETSPYTFVRTDSERPRTEGGLAMRTPGKALDEDSLRPGPAHIRPVSEPSPIPLVPPAMPAPASARSIGPDLAPGADLAGGLPLRTPGAAFTEATPTAESTRPSEMGAEGIRSALSAYQAGQSAAENPEPTIPLSDPTLPGNHESADGASSGGSQ
jgi:hypothetical protein